MDDAPTTRAEAREAADDTTERITTSAPQFLPLGARRVLYVLGLAGAVAAPVIAVTDPSYAAAVVTAAGILNAAALGTALANPPR